MQIALVCNDTRGGIEPYVALAIGLRDTGHAVRAVAPGDLAHLFVDQGIAVAPLSGAMQARMQETGVAERGTMASMRMMARELPRLIPLWTRETLAACEGVQGMTGGIGGMVTGLAVADRLGVPFIPSLLQPIGAPTTRYPGVLLSGIPDWLGPIGRWISHPLTDAALWMPFSGAMRLAAKTLGVPRRASQRAPQPTLYGFSPRVVPLPTASRSARHVTGYWRMPDLEWQPDGDLAEFVARGGPLVSIGFGSMTSDDPEALAALIAGAVHDAGVRAVVLGGWSGLATTRSNDVLVRDAVPHDWLFTHMMAAVHHGGAGTTGAALTAGIPATAIPFAVDQPFWGRRLAALGVGLAPVPRRALTRGRLANLLRAMVSDAAMQGRARALGQAIRQENGVGAAVAVLERAI